MKKFLIIFFLFFLFSCNSNNKSLEKLENSLPEISYSGLTERQIIVLEDFLKEFEQNLRKSEEKFSEKTIQQALYIKKREEVQKFLSK